ncbi:MAG: RNA 2',3'-cyclic phosphodiesterase [Chloroflexi bacterium]|nr:RNA 2',3'-cyclic phosphodiesterase [Chloroflexota bacterium]
MKTEAVRCFIAIELPAGVKAVLARLQHRLMSAASAPAKWVDPDSIHLTLKFLGDVSADRIDNISAAMAEAASGIAPLTLQLDKPGAFPSLKRVQIVWVGLSGDTGPLSQLQQRLESNLARLGFAPESRPFSPHLTLARLREQASPQERERLGQVIAAGGIEEMSDFTADAVLLMRSQLTGAGAIYSQIAKIFLKQPL